MSCKRMNKDSLTSGMCWVGGRRLYRFAAHKFVDKPLNWAGFKQYAVIRTFSLFVPLVDLRLVLCSSLESSVAFDNFLQKELFCPFACWLLPGDERNEDYFTATLCGWQLPRINLQTLKVCLGWINYNCTNAPIRIFHGSNSRQSQW